MFQGRGRGKRGNYTILSDGTRFYYVFIILM
jgi:hypothetical protein